MEHRDQPAAECRLQCHNAAIVSGIQVTVSWRDAGAPTAYVVLQKSHLQPSHCHHGYMLDDMAPPVQSCHCKMPNIAHAVRLAQPTIKYLLNPAFVEAGAIACGTRIISDTDPLLPLPALLPHSPAATQGEAAHCSCSSCQTVTPQQLGFLVQ